MCDTKLGHKRQEAEKLKNLKVHQLFSVDILVENIVVTHGPYKNGGDLDHVTESEHSEDEEQGKDSSQTEGLDKGTDQHKNDEITVGLVLIDCGAHTPCDTCPELLQEKRSRSRSPRVKKTCHTISVGTKATRNLSCEPYQCHADRDPCTDKWKPFQLCKSCLEECVALNKPKSKKSDNCTCKPEFRCDFPTEGYDPKYPDVTKKRSKLTLKRSMSYEDPTKYRNRLDDKNCPEFGNKIKTDPERERAQLNKGGDFKQGGDVLKQSGDPVKIRLTTEEKGFKERGDVPLQSDAKHPLQSDAKHPLQSDAKHPFKRDTKEMYETALEKKAGLPDVKSKKSEERENKEQDKEREMKSGSSKDKSKSKLEKDKKGKDAKDTNDAKAKGKGKGKKPLLTVEEPEPPPERPPPQPKPRWQKKCPKPPKVEGPLPPLRVSVSLFHMKDIKINQVDLDKLYPPEDDDFPPLDDSDINQEFDEFGHRVSRENPVPLEKSKKPKAKQSSTKSSGSSKKGKESPKKGNQSSSASSKKEKEPAKKTVQPKPSKEKAGPASKTSSNSKNVVDQNNKHRGINEKELSTALNSISQNRSSRDILENEENTLSKYRDLGGWATAKCSGDLALKQKHVYKMHHLEKERRKEVIASLRGITDFKRGLSFVFSATPYDIITKLLVEKLELTVERCSIKGPVYPIGKVKIRLPTIFRDRVQAGSRMSTMKPLWTCLEDSYPIIDCKGVEVGTLSLYFCLTSLGRAMVSTSLVSESNLYDYTDLAYYIGQSQKGTAPEPRATAFKMCYGNLQQINLKEYDAPNKLNLKLLL